MGGDGGSFAGRVDVVRTKGYKFMRNLGGMGYTPNQQVRETDERLSKNESRELQNSTCALSEVSWNCRNKPWPSVNVVCTPVIHNECGGGYLR